MPWIAEEKCVGCGICVRECPVEAIALDSKIASIDDDVCIRCGKCHGVCPTDAVRHDGDRLPLLFEANRQYVSDLLMHYETPDDRLKLLTKLIRHFENQGKVAGATVAWIRDNTDGLSAQKST